MIITDQKMNDFFGDLEQAIQEIFESGQYEKIEKKESYFHSENLNLNYDTMVKNLEFIYNGEVDEKVTLFDNVLAFLRNIVMVDNIEVLFSKHFYDIEWNMFMEYDFKKGDMRYYRDHFIHQIRNAYLGYLLIWKNGFKDIILSALKKYPDYPAAKYILLANPILEERTSEINAELFEAVLRKTWFIASIFHDIGYPLSYQERNCEKMEQFMPFAKAFYKQQNLPFSELVAQLSSSYLFKVVDHNELQKQFEKCDHGMISAVCLLLSYYNTGLIHSINPIDKCAIELASYSIFAHTREYTIQGKDAIHGRPVFVEDPFAFLLRLCDDLQEWQRLYFYVSDNTNSLICQKCYKRMTRKQENNTVTYSCDCGQLEKITSFAYKKINYICVCDSITIEQKDEMLCFTLNYDYLKLLEILEINGEFAHYRNKELKNLQKLLVNQAMLPKIKINWFLSNNCEQIKIKIVKDYLENRKITLDKLTKLLDEEIIAHTESGHVDAMRKIISDGFQEVQKILQGDSIDDYLEHNIETRIVKEEKRELPNLDNLYFYKRVYEQQTNR